MKNNIECEMREGEGVPNLHATIHKQQYVDMRLYMSTWIYARDKNIVKIIFIRLFFYHIEIINDLEQNTILNFWAWNSAFCQYSIGSNKRCSL